MCNVNAFPFLSSPEPYYAIAKEEGLQYAYIGNTPGHPLEHTYCPECKNIAVLRYGFSIESWNLDANNCCKNCGYPISIIGKPNKRFSLSKTNTKNLLLSNIIFYFTTSVAGRVS